MGRGDGVFWPFSLANANAHFLLRTKYGILCAGTAILSLRNRKRKTKMAIKKEKNKHLTDDLRLALEAAIRERKSF